MLKITETSKKHVSCTKKNKLTKIIISQQRFDFDYNAYAKSLWLLFLDFVLENFPNRLKGTESFFSLLIYPDLIIHDLSAGNLHQPPHSFNCRTPGKIGITVLLIPGGEVLVDLA